MSSSDLNQWTGSAQRPRVGQIVVNVLQRAGNKKPPMNSLLVRTLVAHSAERSRIMEAPSSSGRPYLDCTGRVTVVARDKVKQKMCAERTMIARRRAYVQTTPTAFQTPSRDRGLRVRTQQEQPVEVFLGKSEKRAEEPSEGRVVVPHENLVPGESSKKLVTRQHPWPHLSSAFRGAVVSSVISLRHDADLTTCVIERISPETLLEIVLKPNGSFDVSRRRWFDDERSVYLMRYPVGGGGEDRLWRPGSSSR